MSHLYQEQDDLQKALYIQPWERYAIIGTPQSKRHRNSSELEAILGAPKISFVNALGKSENQRLKSGNTHYQVKRHDFSVPSQSSNTLTSVELQILPFLRFKVLGKAWLLLSHRKSCESNFQMNETSAFCISVSEPLKHVDANLIPLFSRKSSTQY